MRNEMMHRPIVKKELVKYMREKQKSLDGELGRIEVEAQKDDIPVIPHETVVFLQFLLGQLQPKEVLELGTAIGFSSSVMAQCIGENGRITTIERFDVMIKRAKKTHQRLDLQKQICLLEGEAEIILKELSSKTYDFVFMDSAKSKYIVFLPEILRVMKKGAVLMMDDVFQAGTILEDDREIPRGKRAIHRGLNQLLDTVLPHPDLTSTLVPLGDGLLLLTKEKDDVNI
ncbi:MAG: O-methyltransferase [Lactobacillales bacterium]|nr:O-methyltransferase [Lactobacillales bacterium]